MPLKTPTAVAPFIHPSISLCIIQLITAPPSIKEGQVNELGTGRSPARLNGRCALARSLHVGTSIGCLPAIGWWCLHLGVRDNQSSALGTSPEHQWDQWASQPGETTLQPCWGFSLELTVILCLCHFSVSVEIWAVVPVFEKGEDWPCFSWGEVLFTFCCWVWVLLEKGEMQLVLLSLRKTDRDVPRKQGSFWDCLSVPEKQHMKFHVPALGFLNTGRMN